MSERDPLNVIGKAANNFKLPGQAAERASYMESFAEEGSAGGEDSVGYLGRVDCGFYVVGAQDVRTFEN